MARFERLLIWDRRSDCEAIGTPERHSYRLLMVNDERHIGVMLQRIMEQLGQAYEETPRLIRKDRLGNGLHGVMYEIDSVNPDIDMTKVYLSAKRDPRLGSIQDPEGWMSRRFDLEPV